MRFERTVLGLLLKPIIKMTHSPHATCVGRGNYHGEGEPDIENYSHYVNVEHLRCLSLLHLGCVFHDEAINAKIAAAVRNNGS